MTAARLRAAAAVLREVADGATPGPWMTRASHLTRQGIGADVYSDAGSVTSDGEGYQGASTLEDARYIATMSPPVALAVAAWLEHTVASRVRVAASTKEVIGLDYAEDSLAVHPWALAVADAVLGDRAEVGS